MKLFCLATLAAAVLVTVPASAAAQTQTSTTWTVCGDYATWQDAYNAWSASGEPWRGDMDGDGIPCEWMEGAPDEAPVPVPAPEDPADVPEEADPTPETHACGIRQLPVSEAKRGVYNFRPACQKHDLCYVSMKNGVRYTQKWCDDQFREQMVAHCNKRRKTATKRNRVLCVTRAEVYYLAVRGPLGIWAYDVLTPRVVERDLG